MLGGETWSDLGHFEVELMGFATWLKERSKVAQLIRIELLLGG